MADVFISYSRKNNAVARRLHESLAAHGFDPWIDWEDIPPSADWLAEVFQAIESVDTFVFLLSPASLGSQICLQEIEHALQNHKRLIPLVVEDVVPADVPKPVAALNWIFCRPEQDDFDLAFENLLKAVQTDLDWVKNHTRLQMRALEWEKRGYDPSFLLRGRDLQDAEAWLVQASAQKEPQPTGLQTRYLLASRQENIRRGRKILAAVSLALVVALVLAGLAFWQRNVAVQASNLAEQQRDLAEASGATARSEAVSRATAQQNAIIAESTAVSESYVRATAQARAETESQAAIANRLAVQANQLREQQPDRINLSVLLGVESLYHTPSLVGSQALRRGLAMLPRFLFQIDYQPGKYAWEYGVDLLAYSPDSRYLAINYSDEFVHIWDITSRKKIFTILPADHLYGTVPKPRSIAFSPTRSLIAVGTDANQIAVWDYVRGEKVATLFDSDQVWTTAFFPDGKYLLSSSYGQTQIWRTADWSLLYRIGQGGKSAAISPDGRFVGMAGPKNTVSVWDIQTLKEVPHRFEMEQIEGANPPAITVIQFSPDSRWIAVGDGYPAGVWTDPRSPLGGQIKIWDVLLGQEVSEMRHSDEITHLVFSPDNKYLVSAGKDNKVILWDPAQGVQLRTIGENFPAQALAITSDSKSLIVVQRDNLVRKLELATGEMLGYLVSETSRLTQALLFPDNRRIALSNAQGDTQLWEFAGDASAEAAQQFSVGTTVTDLAYSPDGQKLLIASWNKVVTLWDVQKSRTLNQVEFSDPPQAAVYSPNGEWAAAASQEGEVKIWPPDNAAKARVLTSLTRVGSLVFSPNSKILAISEGIWPTEGWLFPRPDSTESASVQLWRPAGRTPYARLEHSGWVNTLAFSPDSRLILTGSDDKIVRLWDLSTNQEKYRIIHDFRVNLVAISPDGQLGASVESCFKESLCRPGVRVWDLYTGIILWKQTLPAPWSPSLAFTPDSKLLMASNNYIRGLGCPQGVGECRNTLYFWYAIDGKLVDTSTSAAFFSVATFAPQTDLFAAGDVAGSLYLSSIDGSQSLMENLGKAEIWRLAFDPTGERLAIGWNDGRVQIISLANERLVEMACAWLPRNLTQEEWRRYLPQEPYRQTCKNLPPDSFTPQADGYSEAPDISADGRWIVFLSSADNLVCDDTNGLTDAFLYDQKTGQTRRISLNSEGKQLNSKVYQLRISADGRYVAFDSSAPVLASAAANDKLKVFLVEPQTGKVRLASKTPEGKLFDDNASLTGLSSDGHQVVFSVNTQITGQEDTESFYLYDLDTDQVTSVDNSQNFTRRVSGDGQVETYIEAVPAEGALNEFELEQIYLRAGPDSKPMLLSAAPDGTPGNRDSSSVSITPNGKYIIFASEAFNLVPDDTNNTWDIFLYDRQLKQLDRISLTLDGKQINGNSTDPAISADGRFVVFRSDARNLTPEDKNNLADIFLVDLLTGKVTLITRPAACDPLAAASSR